MGDGHDVKRDFRTGDSRSLARRIGERILLLAFGLTFVAVSGTFGVSMIRDLIEAHAAESWSETTCRILASRISEQRDADGDATYSPKVTYSYQVGDGVHVGDRYGLHVVSTSYDRARATVERLKPGGDVPCYYDPAKPSRAVIERGLSNTFWLLLAVMFALFVPGVWIAVRALSAREVPARSRTANGGVPGRMSVVGQAARSPLAAPDELSILIDRRWRRSGPPLLALAAIAQAWPVAGYLGHMSVVPLWLWMSIHAVMLPPTYWIAVCALNRTRLTIRGGYLRIERGPLPRRTALTIPCADIRQIYIALWAVRARLVSGTSVSLCMTWDGELARCLERVLEEHLVIEDAPDPDEDMFRKVDRLLERADALVASVRATLGEAAPVSEPLTAANMALRDQLGSEDLEGAIATATRVRELALATPAGDGAIDGARSALCALCLRLIDRQDWPRAEEWLHALGSMALPDPDDDLSFIGEALLHALVTASRIEDAARVHRDLQTRYRPTYLLPPEVQLELEAAADPGGGHDAR